MLCCVFDKMLRLNLVEIIIKLHKTIVLSIVCINAFLTLEKIKLKAKFGRKESNVRNVGKRG